MKLGISLCKVTMIDFAHSKIGPVYNAKSFKNQDLKYVESFRKGVSNISEIFSEFAGVNSQDKIQEEYQHKIRVD